MIINIYKIYNSNFPNEIYIGSTNRNLNARFREHIRDCKNRKITKSLLYNKIRETCKDLNEIRKDFKIELIISEEVEDKKEQYELEQFYITKLNSSLNLKNPNPNIKKNAYKYTWAKNNRDSINTTQQNYRKTLK